MSKKKSIINGDKHLPQSDRGGFPFVRRHTVGHDLAWRVRASYVTAGRGVDGSAYLGKTGSMRAINSLYPVSLDCGYTSSDVMRAFSAKEQIDLFHREPRSLDTFRSLVSYVSTFLRHESNGWEESSHGRL